MENARLRQALGDKTALLKTISEVSTVLSGAQRMLLKHVQYHEGIFMACPVGLLTVAHALPPFTLPD